MKLHRNWMTTCGLALIALAACLYLTACASLAAWLSDANAMLPVFLASAGSILTAIGALTGNPALAAAAATLAKIGTEVKAGIATVQAMISEYESNPSTTLLGQIEETVQAVTDNISALLGDFGLPTEVSAPFVALAQLLLSQFEAWAALIPALKAAVEKDVVGVKMAVSGLNTMPIKPADFTDQWNAIVEANPALGAAKI
jgi:hypothetical protein